MRVTYRVTWIWKCACAYILQNLLENTSTASALVLIGQLHWVKVIYVGTESVCQNCVIGRCAYLHIATFSINNVISF